MPDLIKDNVAGHRLDAARPDILQSFCGETGPFLVDF
jgi:hypothetical protein